MHQMLIILANTLVGKMIFCIGAWYIICSLVITRALQMVPGYDPGVAQYRPDMYVEPTSVMDFYHVFVDMQRGIPDDGCVWQNAKFETAFISHVEKYQHKLNVRSDLPHSFSCVLEVLSHSELWMSPIPCIETRTKRYIFMAKVLIDYGAKATFINTNQGMMNNNLITQGLFHRNVPTEVIKMYARAGADVNHEFEVPDFPNERKLLSGKQTPLTFVLQDDWGACPGYDTGLWMAAGYYDWLALVRVLIRGGADVNLSNEQGF